MDVINTYLSEFLDNFNATFGESIAYAFPSQDDIDLFATRIHKNQGPFLDDLVPIPGVVLLDLLRLDEKTNAMSEESKHCIWQYLHNLYLMAVSKFLSSSELQCIRERSEKALESRAVALVPARDDAASLGSCSASFASSSSQNPDYGDMLHKFGGVMNIVKEVADSFMGSLDLSSMPPLDEEGGGGGGIENVLNFGSLLNSITGVIDQKVQSGEVDLSSLRHQAEGIHRNLSGGNMAFFQDMMKGMDGIFGGLSSHSPSRNASETAPASETPASETLTGEEQQERHPQNRNERRRNEKKKKKKD